MVESLSNMALARAGRRCRSFVLESSKAVFCGVTQPVWNEGCAGAKRHLLSEDVIKLQHFQQKKLAVARRVINNKGQFIQLFGEKLQKNELILKDDLKLLLHLCQSADDMLVARDAIYRYHSENHNLMHGDFKFGPVFIRQCYEMSLDDLAVTMVTDKRLKGFFNDVTSFNITMDMLFTKGHYETALEVLTTMKNQGVIFNKDTLTLAFGTCYKLNTTESYRICTALIEEAQTKAHFIPRHAYCFAVTLALRQYDIEKAQSFYSQIMNTDSRLCQNLKVLILTMSRAVTDALSVMSAAMLPKCPAFVKKTEFSQEVVDVLRLCSQGQPHMTEVEHIVSQLEQANQVTLQTLDDMLCHTPKGKRKPIMEERKTSRRTLMPLRSTLVSE